MGQKKIETIILEKIHPYSLNEKGKSTVVRLIRQYPYDLLIECINISASNYFRYDEKNVLTNESAEVFIDKIGGIAHNKTLNPIEQEIDHIKCKCKKTFSYWDESKADISLHDYVKALQKFGYDINDVLTDLKTDVTRLSNNSRNWSQWYDSLLGWINDIKHRKDNDSVLIEQVGTILPEILFNELLPNVQLLCKQINASYEKNLYDCTAVMMRRLMEGLLVQSYQSNGIEDQIIDIKTGFHFVLDKIIKNAESNATLALSATTKKDLTLFKDLGNYSAHKIWYNCTQQDIKPHLLKYRVIIEELLYKSKLK